MTLRWRPKAMPEKLSRWYYTTKYGVRNLWIFFRAVWYFRSWDYTGLLELMWISARELRSSQELNRHVGSEKETKRLLIVETLCKRLYADEYFRNAGYQRDRWKDLTDSRQSWIAKHSSYMAKQDAIYLGKMMKFIQHWWD